MSKLRDLVSNTLLDKSIELTERHQGILSRQRLVIHGAARLIKQLEFAGQPIDFSSRQMVRLSVELVKVPVGRGLPPRRPTPAA